MAALETKWPTLVEVAKRTDPNGNIAKIAEILEQSSAILMDMPYFEGNLSTGHKSTVRTGIPEPTWRKLNGGVQPTKSTTAVIQANCGTLADYSEVDRQLADLGGNAAAFRLTEDKAKIQGFNNKLARYMFYGNEGTEPEAITGFSPIFSSLSTSVANSENIIDAGGTGSDNRSIWLIVWGDMSAHGIYPKGSTAGLRTEDKGVQTIENVDGVNGRMEAFRTYYEWQTGLFVKDWRFVVRIANIDNSALTKDASSGADLTDLMHSAIERLPDGWESMGRACFYMGRRVREFVRKQATNATKNSTLTIENVGGKRIMSFSGIKLGRVDALAADEVRVV
jgi:hypothetical protein